MVFVDVFCDMIYLNSKMIVFRSWSKDKRTERKQGSESLIDALIQKPLT